MKMRKQDIWVLLFYYAGYSRIRNLFFRILHIPVTRIATFHDILPEALNYFKANIYFLKRSMNVVSLEDFFLGRLSTKKINVVITFDDGYKSWLTYAVPILKKFGLPATFFVTFGFVGLSMEEEAEFMRTKLFLKPNPQRITRDLSYEDVRKIVKEGFAIGGHTLNHVNLGTLQDSAKIKYEIAEDKVKLEQIAGVEIEFFAYPSGKYDNPKINLVEILKELGYKGALTTVSGFNKSRSSPYILHRELTRASMPTAVFRARMYGNYDAVLSVKQWIRMVLQHRRKK